MYFKNSQFLTIVMLIMTIYVQGQAWNASLSDCEDSKSNYGTVYETAAHYWPLKSSSSIIDVITCKAALDVYQPIRTMTSPDGLYGISTNEQSGVKLVTLSKGCLKNMTLCENGFSISMWLKLDPSPSNLDPSGFDVILGSEDSEGKHTGLLMIDHYENGIQVSISTTNYTLMKNISQISRDGGHHVVITWRHDEGILHYVDGKMYSTDRSTVGNGESSPNGIPDLYLSYSTTAGNAKASYRDLAIWNQRLTNKQVQNIYQHTPGCQEIDHRECNMSASSVSDHYTPDHGYLNSHTAWCADPKMKESYFQMELPYLFKINSMVIQGKELGIREYVKTFQVKFSVEAIDWTRYTVNGAVKTFNGLTTSIKEKLIPFENPPIIARYFRIYPMTSTGKKCIRVRLCGVKQVFVNITAAVKTTSQLSSTCSIKVNNKEYCPDKPGHNIVAVSYITGEVVGVRGFDTQTSDSAGDSIVQFINGLSKNTIVIVAVKGSGHRISINARKVLYSVGAKTTNPPPINSAWILIGHKGILQKWIEETAQNGNGLLVLQKLLALITGHRMSHFWPLRKTDYKTAHGNPKHPWYYHYFRDIEGGLDIYHRSGHIGPFTGTIRHTGISGSWSKAKGNDCLFQPNLCPGGLTVSLWLKAEHSGFLAGEKDEPKYPFHRSSIYLLSSNDGHISIESKRFNPSVTNSHFVVLLDYASGQVKEQETFDILNDHTAQDRFTNFLNNVPDGTIVLIVVKQNSQITSPTLINALKAIGAKDPALTSGYRYLLFGYKGLDRWDWIEEFKWQQTSFFMTKKIPILGAWTSEIGIEDKGIKDWQLTTKPSLAASIPHHARLNTDSPGWYGVNVGNYLQIQLPVITVLSGIITQGASNEAAWVKSYTLSYCIDGQTWVFVKDGRVVTEFTGNSDQHSTMTHTFRRTFNTRLLRINPVSFQGKIVMRIEVLKLNNESSEKLLRLQQDYSTVIDMLKKFHNCMLKKSSTTVPLDININCGLFLTAHPWLNHQPLLNNVNILVDPIPLVFEKENYQSRISSTSIRNVKHKPEHAGLYNINSLVSKGCWCPYTNANQYITVTFKERVLVTSIATQGNPSRTEWITVYSLKYKDGNSNMKLYKENSEVKNFKGNSDRHKVVVNQLKSLLYASVIEIHPISWHGHSCLRFEIYGYPIQSACFGAIGIEDLYASKYSHNTHKAEKARIGLNGTAWCSFLNTLPVYLQVDLGEPALVTGIATKGLNESNYWTKQFYVAYKQDGFSWTNHTRDSELRILEGNTDGSSVVVNPIDPSLEARFIRIYPLEGSSNNKICLQIQLYGCFKENPQFALVGPVEIIAPTSLTINIVGSYRFCPQAVSCPGCKRQVYLEVFESTKCVVSQVLYDCRYHQFSKTYLVPSIPGVYNVRLFDVVGGGCDINMKRNVSGKIVGRVLVKAYSAKSCLDVLLKGHRKSGVYHIRPKKIGPIMTVNCDQMPHGGGWTIIQRRINGTLDFYKTWNEYKDGFGDIEGEFWLGNDNIHLLTSTPVELLIEMKKFSGDYFYAKYDSFLIDSEQDKYKLHVSGYSGTAGDSLSLHNEANFSTKDRNNDPGNNDCPKLFSSAWWFKQCKDADLNGVYVATESGTVFRGIKWETLLGMKDNLKTVQMKIRPKQDSLIRCFESECFYLLKDKTYNFYEAHEACLSMGAELASVTSANETTALADMMSKAGITSAYIGLNDIIKEGYSEWIDGSRTIYQNWHQNTGSGKDCVFLSKGGKWCPAYCSGKYRIFCKRNLMCFKGSCYKSVANSVTNSAAKSMCQQDGMHLIKVPTRDKMSYVRTNMVPKPDDSFVWMGLSDKISDGKFLWHDNSSVTNGNWANEAKPIVQNGEHVCVVLKPNQKWKTVSCSTNAGPICQKTIARSCLELLELGETTSGVYYIYPYQQPRPIKVYCDQEQDGGGWEVFFRRQDGSITFHDKLWNDFKHGFGDPEKEFWLGLKNIAGLTSREMILRLNSSDGRSKYIHYGHTGVHNEKYSYKIRLSWHRGGSLNGEIGRTNDMPFSTLDKDNDRVVNTSCAKMLGPGWIWASYNYKECLLKGVNLFGPYNPTAVGNESNLFYAGFSLPITYIEMKLRYVRGNDARTLVGTSYPNDGSLSKGFSLQYIPHQFTFHFSTTYGNWFLFVSPSSTWMYYTFSWSQNHGLRTYENAQLVLQKKEFRDVHPRSRNYFFFNVGEVYTKATMYSFLTRMKVWNRDLTENQVNADFKEAHFTFEGDVAHWDKADTKNPYNWVINSNCTKSKDTGPCLDHTYGFPQGSYYYLESSYPIRSKDSVSVNSPVFFPKYHKCFWFWYFMYGETMGELIVEIETYNRVPHTLTVNTIKNIVWKKSGNYGKQWKMAVIKIDAEDLFVLKITGIVGQGYKSDIAIDDLSVTMSECPENIPSCTPPCKPGFACLEEKAQCDCKGLKYVDMTCYDELSGTIFRDAAHYWPLDETFDVKNLLGVVHGNTTGSVTSVPGPVNTALETDGITGQIILGDMSDSCILSSPSCPEGFSMSFWLKISENYGKENRIYLSLGHDKERSRGIKVLQDFNVIDNQAHLIINATIEETSCVIAFEVHAAIWSVMSLVWSRTNGLTLYHNGKNVTNYQLYQCVSVASVYPSNSLLRTGYEGISPALTIDDAVIWYKVLTLQEIRKNFRFFTAPQNTLILSLKFEDEVFVDRLRDRESQEFNTFNNKILENVKALFEGKSINFEDIFINNLSNGSVNARLSLFFHEITSRELEILSDAVCQQQAFNTMRVKLLNNSGTVFLSSSDIHQVTFCENRPLKGPRHRLTWPSCLITSNVTTTFL